MVYIFLLLFPFDTLVLIMRAEAGGGGKVCVCEHRLPPQPEEDAGLDGTGITSSYELLGISAENQIPLEPYLLLTSEPSLTAL